MNYSQIKQIKAFCKSLNSDPSFRYVVTSLVAEEKDFTVDGVRFINDSSIDAIQQDELSDDLYMLGCFSDWFLADVLDLDIDVIKALQKAEAFEAIGKMILSMGKIQKLQERYSSYDGYGHYFNRYDGNEEELRFHSETYHVFDNRD